MSDHLVGQRVRVRWDDGSYYGQIVAIPEDETKRTVLYDDGEIIDEDVADILIEEDSFDKKRRLTKKQKVGVVSSSSEEEQSSSTLDSLKQPDDVSDNGSESDVENSGPRQCKRPPATKQKVGLAARVMSSAAAAPSKTPVHQVRSPRSPRHRICPFCALTLEPCVCTVRQKACRWTAC